MSSGSSPGRMCRDVFGDSDWARSGSARALELQRSSEVIQPALRGRHSRWLRCPPRRLSSTLATLGLQVDCKTCHFLTEAGCEVRPRVWSDSSACRGTVRKQGTGRAPRHLDIRHMWTQERPQKGEFLLKSVRTDENVADLMTKHPMPARIEELLSKFGVRRCTRSFVTASLFARVGADCFDGRTERVATVSVAQEVVLLVVVCVFLVLVLVVLAAAGGLAIDVAQGAKVLAPSSGVNFTRLSIIIIERNMNDGYDSSSRPSLRRLARTRSSMLETHVTHRCVCPQDSRG